MLIFVIEIMFEIVIEIGKPFSTMQKIVIEIVIEIAIEYFRTSSARFEKFWLKLTKNQSWNQHGYFYVTGSTVQKIGGAQADFFW